MKSNANVRTVFLILAAVITIAGCSFSPGFVNSGMTGEPYGWSGTGNGELDPGQITAGEWDDLENWNFWTDLYDTTFDSQAARWGMFPGERIRVVVTNGGTPCADIDVMATGTGDRLLWTAKTDSTGTAYLFPRIFTNEVPPFTVTAIDGTDSVSDTVDVIAETVQVALEFPKTVTVGNKADILFMVDTTGSMSDELEYLKVELKDVIERVASDNASTDVRLSCNFYRDEGDEYVVRSNPFTADIQSVVDDLALQSSMGGGDWEEAVEQACDDAINSHQWSESARARLMFLVLDAPPHYTQDIVQKMRDVTMQAASKGIRIIPVAASGIDTDTEALLRFMDIATNGSYVFITDHSGIGGTHHVPTVGEYQVEQLNDLLVRVIGEYID
jgi:hypothetical protein